MSPGMNLSPHIYAVVNAVMQEHMRTVFSFTSSSALKISHHTLLRYVKQESIWVLGNAVKELGVVAWPRKNGSISLLVIKNWSQGRPGNYYHGRIRRVDDEMICAFVMQVLCVRMMRHGSWIRVTVTSTSIELCTFNLTRVLCHDCTVQTKFSEDYYYYSHDISLQKQVLTTKWLP